MAEVENTLQSSYLQILSKGIEDLWLSGSYTDVILHVDNKEFQCHRIILGAVSHFFNAMFRSGMRESHDKVVNIQDLDSETFEAILKFIYTGEDVLTKENVENVLQASVMLQIRCLQDFCETFLRQQLGPENCLGIWKLASMFGCTALAKKSWNYILEYFSTVIRMEEFGHLEIDNLIDIINDDDLNISSEEEVCDAVINWVEANPVERVHQLEKLFTYIRFPYLDSSYVDGLRQHKILVESDLSLKILNQVYNYLTAASDLDQMSVTPRQFQHRQEEMMCVVGTRSRHPNPQATEIKYFSFRRDTEYVLAALPEEPGACFAVCECNNDVYVSGGYHGQTLLLQYITLENRWVQCHPLQEGRWGHGMVSVNDSLYIIGGSTRTSDTLSSIERYIPGNDRSEIIGGLYVKVSFMASAVIGHRIYIFGGKLHDRTLSQNIQAFDTKTGHCAIVGQMPLVSSTANRVAVVDNAAYIFYRQSYILEYKVGGEATVVGHMPNFDHYGVVPHKGQVLIVGSQSNQHSAVLFNPHTKAMTTYKQTIKAALCNFHCMKVISNKQHIRPVEDQEPPT